MWVSGKVRRAEGLRVGRGGAKGWQPAHSSARCPSASAAGSQGGSSAGPLELSPVLSLSGRMEGNADLWTLAAGDSATLPACTILFQPLCDGPQGRMRAPILTLTAPSRPTHTGHTSALPASQGLAVIMSSESQRVSPLTSVTAGTLAPKDSNTHALSVMPPTGLHGLMPTDKSLVMGDTRRWNQGACLEGESPLACDWPQGDGRKEAVAGLEREEPAVWSGGKQRQGGLNSGSAVKGKS